MYMNIKMVPSPNYFLVVVLTFSATPASLYQNTQRADFKLFVYFKIIGAMGHVAPSIQ